MTASLKNVIIIRDALRKFNSKSFIFLKRHVASSWNYIIFWKLLYFLYSNYKRHDFKLVTTVKGLKSINKTFHILSSKSYTYLYLHYLSLPTILIFIYLSLQLTCLFTYLSLLTYINLLTLSLNLIIKLLLTYLSYWLW